MASLLSYIRHNAKGRGEAIWYGNGTRTSYVYNALSHWLTRLLTVKLATNEKVQDLSCFYDPSGNITTIRDDVQQVMFYDNHKVSPDMDYTYDALYRLVRAQGRESVNNPGFSNDNWDDAHAFVNDLAPFDGSTAALRSYVQQYSYDDAGNILRLKHIAGGSTTGSYTRVYDYEAGSNRLASTTVGSNTPYLQHYDGRGNMVSMAHLGAMDYDALSQMSQVRAGTAEAYYRYSSGQRIKKRVVKGSSSEQRIYIGSWELYRSWSGTTLDVARTTVHVSDGQGRIAILEVKTHGSDDSAATLTRYIYSNHLSSSALELNGKGAVISYEEYHPYGTTAYQGRDKNIKAVAKRYRYTGKERDEESGLNYHGARYYAPWLARWCAVDPLKREQPTLPPCNYFNTIRQAGMIRADEGCDP